jgi:macrolide transport system ATP-binding/permease protein
MIHYLRALVARFRGVFGDRRTDWEFDDEIQAHLELLTERYARQGMTEAEAARTARRQFGNVTLLKEVNREMRRIRVIDSLIQDVRYGARMLLRHKGFTAVAILSLALGIGANTAIFSLADALLWRGLPMANHDRLFIVKRGGGTSSTFSYPDYVDYRDRNQVFEGLAAYNVTMLAFGNGERSEVVMGESVTGNYFDVLGVPMAQGRAFAPEEDRTPGTHPVAVVSYDFWQRRFGGDPHLVGKTLTFNNRSFTVIGIAAAGFVGASVPMQAEVWVPIMIRAMGQPGGAPELNDRQAEILDAIAQLKAGASRAQAEAELETINRQLQQAYPAPNRFNQDAAAFQQGRRMSLAPARGTFIQNLRQMVSQAAMLATTVACLVLLIACANIANLLLARGAGRRNEIAIRLAIGAGRIRLIRQLLTESLLLALAGGAVGLLLAFWINQLLMSLQPPFPPPFDFKADLRLDGRVLGFTLLLSMLTGVVFGLAPAWAATKPDVISALKDETRTSDGRRRFALRNLLVVAQIALSLILLVGAGLFIQSLHYVQAIDPGFDTRNGLVMSLNPGSLGYSEDGGRQFQSQLVERLAGLPGVSSVTTADYFPLGFIGISNPITIEGQAPPPDGRPMMAVRQRIGLRYFETMGIPLLRGRAFTAADTASSEPVVIVNQTLARRHWPISQDIGEVIGRRIRIGFDQNALWSVIVGVAGDCKYWGLGEAQQAGMWTPLSQNYAASFQALVRVTAEAPGVASAIRREVAALDANLPVQNIMTLHEQVSLWLWPSEMGAGLFSALGSLGLLLAAIGLYGVMSYAVTQRTHEIGIRMALGAQARDVLGVIIWQGLRLTLVGLAIGLAAALALTRLVASLLYGVSVRDPLTFAGVPLVLAAVAWLACYIPARRATKVDPLLALRHE